VPTGVREVNVPGETGLEVPLQDVAALAEALETLAHDPFKREQMGDAGRRRVEKYFTRALMAQRHIETVRAGARLLDCGSSGSRLARQMRISAALYTLKKLPPRNAEYPPKILAAAVICRHPQRYAIDPPGHRQRFRHGRSYPDRT
jgi:hypothetical protein